MQIMLVDDVYRSSLVINQVGVRELNRMPDRRKVLGNSQVVERRILMLELIGID